MRRKWRTGVVLAGTVILIWLSSHLLFHSVMDPLWVEQRAAVQTAYEKTVLARVEKVQQFVGDQSYTVITGEDKIGQPIYVWVGSEGIRTEPGTGNLGAEAAAALVSTKHPGAEILRTMPGIQNGAPVWEIFYKLTPEGAEQEQYFYDYYTFKDGQPIDTWRLSIQ